MVFPPIAPVLSRWERDRQAEADAEAIEKAMTPTGTIIAANLPPHLQPPNPAQVSIPTTAATPADMARLRLDELDDEREIAEAEAQAAEAAIIGAMDAEIAEIDEAIAEVSEPEGEPVTVKVAPVVQRDPSGLMHFPVRNATDRIELDSENRDVLETYWKKHISGDQSILAIVGPSGTGKTSLIWDLAAEKSVGLFMFDAAGASSFTDWTGTTVLRQGEGSPVTEFITSAFIEFARIDGPCAGRVRLGGIDELNRAESGGALNALLPILAQGQLFIPELGETIVFDPAVMWMFTMNRGSAYNATLSLDAALSDRVQAWVKLDNLTEKEEIKLLVDRTGVDATDAARLVATAAQVRIVADRGELTHSISIRRTLDAARAVKHGLSLMQAAMFCWANSYLDEGGQESDRGKVETAIRTTLGTATTDNSTPW